MEITRGFYDLSIPFSDRSTLQKLVKELIEIGYRTIAIEQIFDHSKKTSEKRADIFPAPEDISFLKEFESKIKIFSRLTIIYSDASVSHPMSKSVNLQKFHIIAGQPKNDAAWTHCCSTFAGDIISFSPEDPKIFINRKTYQVAVNRGLFFEIKYSEAIRNSSHRKDMIKVTHNYHSRGKSKAVVMSSGAENIFELRGPYDVANLGLIFGLSEEQGKNAIGSNCRKLLLNAESRRAGKTFFIMTAKGPIVFSSSEDEGSDDDEDSALEDDAMEGIELELQQPSKKKKLG